MHIYIYIYMYLSLILCVYKYIYIYAHSYTYMCIWYAINIQYNCANSRQWLRMQARPFCLMRTPKWLRPKIAAMKRSSGSWSATCHVTVPWTSPKTTAFFHNNQLCKYDQICAHMYRYHICKCMYMCDYTVYVHMYSLSMFLVHQWKLNVNAQ